MSQQVYVAPSDLLAAQPEVPSSKYYTLRYLLAAALADGESRVFFPAESDDSDALFRGCRALGADLAWEDESRQVLHVHGIGRPRSSAAVTIDVGNAGAVLRLLLGLGALLSEVHFTTNHPESLGKRPNRELLEALTTLGAVCEGVGSEGYLPITIHGGSLYGGKITISGARSSQYISSLLFLAPLLDEDLEITVVDAMKSLPLLRATLEVLADAGIQVQYDPATLRHFFIRGGQSYQPRDYVVPGDYPSAAALFAAYAISGQETSVLQLTRLPVADEVGEALLAAFRALGADLQRDGDIVTLRGGRPLHGFRLDGDAVIDCIPVLVAAACFAHGESLIYNVESLHYKECDRIDDLCAELQKAGCSVVPLRDAIQIHGQPDGIEGGVVVNGHQDHRVIMALTIVALRSRKGLTITGSEHIAKSYPHFFAELRRLGADIRI